MVMKPMASPHLADLRLSNETSQDVWWHPQYQWPDAARRTANLLPVFLHQGQTLRYPEDVRSG